MEYFQLTVILLLSLIGIVSLIKTAILSLCRIDKNYGKLLIILDDNCQNPETVIRNSATGLEWSDRREYSSIICVYKGKCSESKEICRLVCEDYPYTTFIDINNFEKSTVFDE